jgi:hypothetical protein
LRQGGVADPASSPVANALDAALPPLDPDQDTLLHLLLAVPALRPIAADDLELEPSHFPSAWQPLVTAILMDPDAGPASIAEADGVSGEPGLQAAVHRLAATPLEARFRPTVQGGAQVGSTPELDAELHRRVEAVRLTARRAHFQRLGLELAEAERRGDFAAAKELFAQRAALQASMR